MIRSVSTTTYTSEDGKRTIAEVGVDQKLYIRENFFRLDQAIELMEVLSLYIEDADQDAYKALLSRLTDKLLPENVT